VACSSLWLLASHSPITARHALTKGLRIEAFHWLRHSLY